MKFLKILTFSFFSLIQISAQANSIEAVKLFDGKAIYCRSEADLETQGYYPSRASVRLINDEAQISLTISGVICGSKHGKISWQPHRLKDTYLVRDIYGEAYPNTPINVDGILVSQNYQLLGSVKLENQFAQMVGFNVTLDSILQAAQKRELDEKGVTKVRLEYFNRYDVDYIYKEELGQNKGIAGGAFALLLTIERNSLKELNVSSIEVK